MLAQIQPTEGEMMITEQGMENKGFTTAKKRGRPALPDGEKKVDAKIMCKEKHLNAVRDIVQKAIAELELSA